MSNQNWHGVEGDFYDMMFSAFSGGHHGFASPAAQMGADGKIKAEKPPEKQLNERLFEEDCPPGHKPLAILNRKIVDGASAVRAIFPDGKSMIYEPVLFAGLRGWDVAVPLRRLVTGGSYTVNPA